MTRQKGRRRVDHEEESHEGSERWLVTYADMLTLLLVLFIVLYSISKVNTSKLSQLRSSLASALGGSDAILDGQSGLGNDSGSSLSQVQPISNSGRPSAAIPDIKAQAAITPTPQAAATVQPKASQPTPSPTPSAGELKKELDEFSKIEKSISDALAKKGFNGDAQFSIDQRGLVVTIITDGLVFPGNSADLLPGGQQIFDAVVPPLVGITNFVEVDGHTNQLNTSTAPYPSGWELSSARASAVVRYLIQRQIPQNRLSANGFSDQRPLYPPSDPRAVTGNRRVDIVVLSNLPASERASLPPPPTR